MLLSGEVDIYARKKGMISLNDTESAQPIVKNILGTKLELCCSSPTTGYFRDGFCHTNLQDEGAHVVCAVMTAEFLAFSQSRGNDLSTPRPEFSFPGLKPGDRWCLCALRWREAYEAGCAPQLNPRATHERALDFMTLEELETYFVS